MKKIGRRRLKSSLANDLWTKGVFKHPPEKMEKFKTATIKTTVMCGTPSNEKNSPYIRTRKAKAHIHEVERMGWPDTPGAIERLIAQMGEDEQLVCYCGRFIRRWNGWRFQFPSTVDVIGAMECGEGVRELKFVESEEN